MGKKLNEILDSIRDNVPADVIAEINSAVDAIKSKAISSSKEGATEQVETLKAQLKAKDEEIAKIQGELKPFQEKAAYEKNLDAYKQTGKGKEDADLSNYNLAKFSDEDGNIDWDKFLESNPHLKKDSIDPPEDKTLELTQEQIKQEKDDMAKEIDLAKLANL